MIGVIFHCSYHFLFIPVIAFVCFGLAGWVLKAFGWVFDFLQEGCSTSFGCLFWVFIIVLFIVGMAL